MNYHLPILQFTNNLMKNSSNYRRDSYAPITLCSNYSWRIVTLLKFEYHINNIINMKNNQIEWNAKIPTYFCISNLSEEFSISNIIRPIYYLYLPGPVILQNTGSLISVTKCSCITKREFFFTKIISPSPRSFSITVFLVVRNTNYYLISLVALKLIFLNA